MSDIDLGEVQARFGFDLSSLQAQTQRAADMVKDMSINIKSAVSGGSGAFNDSLDITQGMNKCKTR